MTPLQTLTVLRFYQDALAKWEPERCPADYDGTPGMGRMVKHALWMVNDVLTRMEAGDMDEGKANRWLGFIQGALWAAGLFTIDDMREHNIGA